MEEKEGVREKEKWGEGGREWSRGRRREVEMVEEKGYNHS